MPTVRSLAALAALLTLSACVTTAPQGPAPPEEEPAPTYPAYETFDPAGYDAEPEVSTDVEHDVPERVMVGRVVVPGGGAAPAPAPAPSGEPREVDGYRVQVFSSNSRGSAERVRAQALAWWQGAKSRAGAPEALEARVVYLQPYYRVRLGAFATREDADAMLRLVRDEFPEAFLVADRVTVRE